MTAEKGEKEGGRENGVGSVCGERDLIKGFSIEMEWKVRRDIGKAEGREEGREGKQWREGREGRQGKG